MKLYKVVIVNYPDGALMDDPFDETYSILDPSWQPDGWDKHSKMLWGEIRDFFWPSTKRLYQSRSGATSRATLIRRWGATAEVVESDPIVWLTPDVIRERRITELRGELDTLEGGAE